MRQAYDYWQDQPGSIRYRLRNRRKSCHTINVNKTATNAAVIQGNPNFEGQHGGRRSRVNSMHRIQEISKRMRAKRGLCVSTAGPSPADQAFLRNPPEIGLGGTGSRRATKYHQVGMQHRNRQQAPLPQGLTGVNEGECMSTVGCTSIEPANKNNPITTHAPPRALDPTPPNPPHPTTPEGERANGDIQWCLVQHR